MEACFRLEGKKEMLKELRCLEAKNLVEYGSTRQGATALARSAASQRSTQRMAELRLVC